MLIEGLPGITLFPQTTKIYIFYSLESEGPTLRVTCTENKTKGLISGTDTVGYGSPLCLVKVSLKHQEERIQFGLGSPRDFTVRERSPTVALSLSSLTSQILYTFYLGSSEGGRVSHKRDSQYIRLTSPFGPK